MSLSSIILLVLFITDHSVQFNKPDADLPSFLKGTAKVGSIFDRARRNSIEFLLMAMPYVFVQGFGSKEEK